MSGQEWAVQVTEPLEKLRSVFEAVYPGGSLFIESDSESQLAPVFALFGFPSGYASGSGDPLRHEFIVELDLGPLVPGEKNFDALRVEGLATMPADVPVRLAQALVVTPYMEPLDLQVDATLLDITAAALAHAGVTESQVRLSPGGRASEYVVWAAILNLVLDVPLPGLTDAEHAQIIQLLPEVRDLAAVYTAVVGA